MQRRHAAHRLERLLLGRLHQNWSMDFVADNLFDGRKIRALTISGCYRTAGFVFTKPYGYHLAYSPNPANKELVVTAVDTDQPDSGSPSTSAPAFEAELYDNRGKK